MYNTVLKGGNKVQKSINKLKKEFNKIKNKSFNKSLRIGSTGIGYTFETLIDKKEDQAYIPDFEGIEIKTKLGYTKSPLTLFSLVPKRYNETAINFILYRFGYPNKNNKKYKAFRGDCYSNYNNIICNRYIFKLKVNREEGKLRLIILNKKLEVLDNTIYWELEILKQRLYTKLNYLALIKGYPYKIGGQTYYKYTNLNIY